MTRTTYRSSLLWLAAACLLVCVAIVATSCATISDPPMPVGTVTPEIVRDYQQSLVDADLARDMQHLRVTRTLNAVCTAADIISTLVAVNCDRCNLKEWNPALPDPKTNAGWFIGVKLSIGAGLDYAARRGYQREVRATSGVFCGVALWNLVQAIK